MVERWTDERLEDLNKKVDDGFAEMRTEFRAIRGEVASLTHAMWGMFGTMIFDFAGIIIAMLTHV
jgi:hypothetical protein